jgi:hypothetical protein
MTTSDIQPPTGLDQQHEFSSALSKTVHAAFVVMVALGALAGTGLVLWLLSVLANSSYGIYFGA